VNHYYSRLKISWNEEKVRVQVENPRGYLAMPQFEAPMAPEMMKIMEMQTRELSGLGDLFSYEWKRSQCELSPDDSWLISCGGAVEAEQKENDVRALMFTTAHIEEKSLSGENKVLRLRFIFEKGKSMFFSAIPFPITLCRKKD